MLAFAGLFEAYCSVSAGNACVFLWTRSTSLKEIVHSGGSRILGLLSPRQTLWHCQNRQKMSESTIRFITGPWCVLCWVACDVQPGFDGRVLQKMSKTTRHFREMNVTGFAHMIRLCIAHVILESGHFDTLILPSSTTCELGAPTKNSRV